MPREFTRSDRVAKQLQKELAGLIRNSVKDPRLGMITVQAVRVNRDLSHAKVYCTLLDDGDRKEQMRLLNHSAAFLRHELGRQMKMRLTPSLEFLYDDSIEQGAHLSELIEQAVRR